MGTAQRLELRSGEMREDSPGEASLRERTSGTSRALLPLRRGPVDSEQRWAPGWAGRQAPFSVTQPPPLHPILRKTLEASAVCRYDLAEVQAVFAGPYMEYQDGVRRWGRYEGGVPEPRPGSVSAEAWGQC